MDRWSKCRNVKLWCNTIEIGQKSELLKRDLLCRTYGLEHLLPLKQPSTAATYHWYMRLLLLLTWMNIDSFHSAGIVLRRHSNFYITGPTPCICLKRVSNLLSCLLSGDLHPLLSVLLPKTWRSAIQYSANFLSACASKSRCSSPATLARLAKMTFQPLSLPSPVWWWLR